MVYLHEKCMKIASLAGIEPTECYHRTGFGAAQPAVAATTRNCVCVQYVCVGQTSEASASLLDLRHSVLILAWNPASCNTWLSGSLGSSLSTSHRVQYSDWITWSPSYGGGNSSTPRVLMPLLSKHGPCVRWPAIWSHGPLPWPSTGGAAKNLRI